MNAELPSQKVQRTRPRVDPFDGTAYRALSILGSGAMAEVFAVEHRSLYTKYAAKLLRSSFASDRRTVDRMRLEADALARIEHQNVVALHGYFETADSVPFIIMDLLQGQTLHELLQAQPAIPVQNALVFAIDLLNGLEAVHQLGIVHRDLKPSNLFLHDIGNGLHVLTLLDFGAARILPGVSEQAPMPLILPTRTGTAIGTPRFMSPEAAMGQPVDVRSDIYSAGVVLYRMLAGRGPYDHIEGNPELLHTLVNGTPPPPSRFLAHSLPPAVEAAIMRSLAKNPGDRFHSVVDFANTLVDLVIADRQTGELATPNISISARRSGHSLYLTEPKLDVQLSPQPGPSSPAQRHLFDALRSTLGFLLLFLITTAVVVIGSRLLPR